MSAIRAEHLFKVFGSHPERALEPLRAGEDRDEVYRRTGQLGAVVDATFTVESGELFVVMGLSGSGKSTLVRTLIRLIEPSAGKIQISGRDVICRIRLPSWTLPRWSGSVSG
jgi:glycine betaine/proline transport system ATP-binding protein